jgi:hypothetical protein
MKAFVRGDCGGVGSDSPGIIIGEETKKKEKQVKEKLP